ncbi:MAG TPA: hypothetical protein PK948_12180, partial [Gemmatimonadales bacterium]|nr:hypothetical protein [Gemmatimonadales bacterium]
LAPMALIPQTTTELPELVVSGRSLLDVTTAAVTVNMSPDEFSALPVDQSYRSLVELLPQANASYYGDAVNVGGATGAENAWYVDGVNVTGVSLGTTGIDLPWNFVREVQVTTGAGEADFGRALGGGINVVTKSGGDRWAGDAFAFVESGSLGAEPRTGALGFALDARTRWDLGFSLGGPLLGDKVRLFAAYNPTFTSQTVTPPGLYPLPGDQTRHLAAAKLGWRAGNATDVTLTLLADYGSGEVVGNSPFATFVGQPTVVESPATVSGVATSSAGSLALGAVHRWRSGTWLRGWLSRYNQRNDVDPADSLAESLTSILPIGPWTGGFGGLLHSQTSRTAASLAVGVPHGASEFVASLGWERNAEQSKDSVDLQYLSGQAPFAYVAVGNTTTQVPTVFLQEGWQASERLRLNLGLRWDGAFGNGLSIGSAWQPRLGAVWQLGELGTQALALSAGRYYEQLPALLTRVYPEGAVQEGVVDDEIYGQYLDEITLGFERLAGNTRIGLRGTFRTLRWAIEDAYVEGIGWTYGNPGRGALSGLPRATRDYASLEASVVGSAGRSLSYRLSYVLSRTTGNYTGGFVSDLLYLNAPNAGPQFDFPDQLVSAQGLLPNDRTHVFKLSGGWNATERLEVGVTALLASGTPLSEYGAAYEGLPYWRFLSERGTAGRTPALWDANLRVGYLIPLRTGNATARLLLDLLHIGNPETPTVLEQRRYFDNDAAGDPTLLNPRYGETMRYQPPMGARLGLMVQY